jgi:uroporphyrinogen-III synthase
MKMPNESISGYFFSSPSTVVAFYELFGKPQELPIRVQGKVTRDQFIQTFGKFKNLEIL